MFCQGSRDKHDKSDKLVQITHIHVLLFKIETQAGQNPSLLFLCVFIDPYFGQIYFVYAHFKCNFQSQS